MKEKKLLERIAVNQQTSGGKPIIHGDDGSQAAFKAADAQAAGWTKLKRLRRARSYPWRLFEIPVILDHHIRCLEEFVAGNADPRSQRVAFLAVVGLVNEMRLQTEEEGPLGTAGISAFNLSDDEVVKRLNGIRDQHPIALIRPLLNAIKHHRSSLERELSVSVVLGPPRTVDIRFNKEMLRAWRANCRARGRQPKVPFKGKYHARSVLDLFRDMSKTIRGELEAVAKKLGVGIQFSEHQALFHAIFDDELQAFGH